MKKTIVIFLMLLCFIGNTNTIYPQGRTLWLTTLFSEPPAPSYKVYTAIMSQSGTNAPTLTVLENTLGATISSSYLDVGFYSLTVSDAILLVGKTIVICSAGISGNACVFNASRVLNNTIYLNSYNTSNALANGYLTSATIEIRVYP